MSITVEKTIEVKVPIKVIGETLGSIDVVISNITNGTPIVLAESPVTCPKISGWRYMFTHTFVDTGLYLLEYSNGAISMTDTITVTEIDTVPSSMENVKSNVESIVTMLSYTSRYVHIDTGLAGAGTGTSVDPFNSVAAGLDYLVSSGINNVIIHSDVSLDRELHDVTIESFGDNTITTDDVLIKDFSGTTVRGAMINSRMDKIKAINCVMTETNLWGEYLNCRLIGALTAADAKSLSFDSCVDGSSGITVNRPSLSLADVALNCNVTNIGFVGGLELNSITDATTNILLGAKGTELVIGESCVLGKLEIYGEYELNVNPAATTTIVERFSTATETDVISSEPDLTEVLHKLDVANSGF